MRAMPRDEGVTAETDPEPMRWTFDDAQAAMELGWGMFQMGGGHYIPYILQTTAFSVGTTCVAMKYATGPTYTYTEIATIEESAATIKHHAADGSYVAKKALVILSAQKLCGQ